MMMAATATLPIVEILVVLLVALAIVLARLSDLFAAVVLLSAYSGILAILFSLLGAPDVAFTEAVVGAGVSAVLFVMLLRRVDLRVAPAPRKRRLVAGILSTALGGALAVVVSGLPTFGDPTAPAATHVAPEYVARSLADMATPNVVTAVLADYRGFDTLIETAVIYTAAVACVLVIGRRP